MTYDRLILVLRYCLPDRTREREAIWGALGPEWVGWIRKLGLEP